jgi:hypothetical protein
VVKGVAEQIKSATLDSRSKNAGVGRRQLRQVFNNKVKT